VGYKNLSKEGKKQEAGRPESKEELMTCGKGVESRTTRKGEKDNFKLASSKGASTVAHKKTKEVRPRRGE